MKVLHHVVLVQAATVVARLVAQAAQVALM